MSDLRSYVNTLYKIVDEPVDNIHFVIYKDCTIKEKTYYIGIHKLKYKKSFGEIIVSEENLRKLAESQAEDFIKCNCLSELLLWSYFDDYVELYIYRNYQGKVKGCLDSICFDKNTWKLIQTKILDYLVKEHKFG